MGVCVFRLKDAGLRAGSQRCAFAHLQNWRMLLDEFVFCALLSLLLPWASRPICMPCPLLFAVLLVLLLSLCRKNVGLRILSRRCWFVYFVAVMLVCVRFLRDVGLRSFSQRC